MDDHLTKRSQATPSDLCMMSIVQTKNWDKTCDKIQMIGTCDLGCDPPTTGDLDDLFIWSCCCCPLIPPFVFFSLFESVEHMFLKLILNNRPIKLFSKIKCMTPSTSLVLVGLQKFVFSLGSGVTSLHRSIFSNTCIREVATQFLTACILL